MQTDLGILKKGLGLSVTKKVQGDRKGRTSSIAYSKSDYQYLAGNIESDTNLLDISSEQAALVLAIHQQDFRIHEVHTLVEENTSVQTLSPLTIKILADHSVRTGETIRYVVFNTKGTVLLETRDVRTFLPMYTPSFAILEKIHDSKPSYNWVSVSSGTNIITALKEHAISGLVRNFTTYNSASSYGASVVTKSGTLYFGGQYSSFEKRTGLHAEMAVATSALMHNDKSIIQMGLVSTKYKDTPCELCGCCRQFLSELAQKFSWNLEIITFALDTNDYKKYSLTELLPNKWSSKKW